MLHLLAGVDGAMAKPMRELHFLFQCELPLLFYLQVVVDLDQQVLAILQQEWEQAIQLIMPVCFTQPPQEQFRPEMAGGLMALPVRMDIGMRSYNNE